MRRRAFHEAEAIAMALPAMLALSRFRGRKEMQEHLTSDDVASRKVVPLLDMIVEQRENAIRNIKMVANSGTTMTSGAFNEVEKIVRYAFQVIIDELEGEHG